MKAVAAILVGVALGWHLRCRFRGCNGASTDAPARAGAVSSEDESSSSSVGAAITRFAQAAAGLAQPHNLAVREEEGKGPCGCS